jgi:hypothetical protein
LLLVGCVLISGSISAAAQGRLSIRGGLAIPQKFEVTGTSDVLPGGGLAYELPWVPHVFNGEHWTTSVSADFFYIERCCHVL